MLNSLTHNHEERRDELPAEVPESANPESEHVLKAVVDLVGTETVTDGKGLEKGGPQQRHSTGRVEIHQLENVNSSLKELEKRLCIRYSLVSPQWLKTKVTKVQSTRVHCRHSEPLDRANKILLQMMFAISRVGCVNCNIFHTET